jgi:hypothetical protein
MLGKFFCAAIGSQNSFRKINDGQLSLGMHQNAKSP